MRILFDIFLIVIGFTWCSLAFLLCDKDTLDYLLRYRDYFKWLREDKDERESDESDNRRT